MKPLIGTDLKRFLRDYKREQRPAFEIAAILQSVEYPANVGSCFRLADGAGMSELILTGITPTPPNATIEKVGRFKSSRVPWRYEKDPLEAIAGMKEKGYQVVAVEISRYGRALPGLQLPAEDLPRRGARRSWRDQSHAICL